MIDRCDQSNQQERNVAREGMSNKCYPIKQIGALIIYIPTIEFGERGLLI